MAAPAQDRKRAKLKARRSYIGVADTFLGTSGVGYSAAHGGAALLGIVPQGVRSMAMVARLPVVFTAGKVRLGGINAGPAGLGLGRGVAATEEGTRGPRAPPH